MRFGISAAASLTLQRNSAAANLEPFHFDGNRVPFSRYGSYLTVSNHFWPFGISNQVPAGEFYIRCLQDDPSPPEVFRITALRNGLSLKMEADAKPGRLLLRNGTARLEFCISGLDTIRLRGTGCVLQLATVTGGYASAVRMREGLWQIYPDAARSPVAVRGVAGAMNVNAPWVNHPHHVQVDQATITFSAESEAGFEAELQFFEGLPGGQGADSFDASATSVQAEFETWAAHISALNPLYETGRKLAAYVLWSSTVAPRGLYRNPVVLGSKNWMARIWSWDHCFAALGLARWHPELAWQQYILFRNMQDPRSGMLADSMSNIKRSWVCTKNPVHGWTLRHLMRLMPATLTQARLQEAYEPLRLWTEYWLRERNLDHDGLPCILHPNESFDNTTANTMGGAVKAPETAAYLVLQLDTLSDLARKLGAVADSTRWRKQSEALVAALLQTLWKADEQRFVTRRVGDGVEGPGDSIFAFMPLLLGSRLPAGVRGALVNGLKTPGRFLTPHGLSTEAVTSPLYDAGSYVRGPVWAPVNVFLSEALEGAGEVELAKTIRHRFLQNCLAGGMSEHFDAKTGAPEGDPAYIWTAAMFLYLGA